MKIFNILLSFAEFVAPKKERTRTVERMRTEDAALSPVVKEYRGARITSLTSYREPAIEALIRSLKYDRNEQAAAILAAMLREFIQEELADHTRFFATQLILCPLPMHPKRKHERGFDQIELALSHLPKIDTVDLSVDHGILRRIRNTAPQTKLPRSERLRNMKGAFALAEGVNVRGRHIYVVDDVTTTGSTLAEAVHTLENAGAIAEGVAFARS